MFHSWEGKGTLNDCLSTASNRHVTYADIGGLENGNPCHTQLQKVIDVVIPQTLVASTTFTLLKMEQRESPTTHLDSLHTWKKLTQGRKRYTIHKGVVIQVDHLDRCTTFFHWLTAVNGATWCNLPGVVFKTSSGPLHPSAIRVAPATSAEIEAVNDCVCLPRFPCFPCFLQTAEISGGLHLLAHSSMVTCDSLARLTSSGILKRLLKTSIELTK